LAIQDLVLRQTLLLLHPFIPFVTEELWQLLGFGAAGRFIESYDLEFRAELLEKVGKFDERAVAEITKLQQASSQVRGLKAEYNLASRRDVRFFVTLTDAEWAVLEANLPKMLRMVGASEIVRRTTVDGAPAVVTPAGTFYLDVASTVDVAAEKQRLQKEIEKLTQHIAATEARLANTAFTSKAPAAVLEGAKKQLADQTAKREELKRLLASL
jgi:valyl-tRNA synthetase